MNLLDPESAAPLLGCTPQTIEDRLRDGTLPGIKLGRSWVIPAQALEQRLCELAVDQARERRAAAAVPSTVALAPDLARKRRNAPDLTQRG